MKDFHKTFQIKDFLLSILKGKRREGMMSLNPWPVEHSFRPKQVKYA